MCAQSPSGRQTTTRQEHRAWNGAPWLPDFPTCTAPIQLRGHLRIPGSTHSCVHMAQRLSIVSLLSLQAGRAPLLTHPGQVPPRKASAHVMRTILRHAIRDSVPHCAVPSETSCHTAPCHQRLRATLRHATKPGHVAPCKSLLLKTQSMCASP